MSLQEEAVVRAGYEAQARGDVDGMVAMVSADFTLDVSRRAFDAAVYRGRDGLRQFLERQATVWHEQRLVPEKFISRGDAVVVPVRLESVGRESGVKVTARTAHVWTVRDGKAVRMVVYQTLDEALEALS